MPDAWAIVDGLLDAVLAVPEAERAAWLRAREPDQPAAIAQVRRMLAELDASAIIDRVSDSSLIAEAFAAIDHDAVPERIGPWRLLRRLGSGGMADVFEAERDLPGTRQRAALKLTALGVHDPAAQARFQQETQVLARLDDPRIARLIDAGIADDGRAWLAMECVSGVAIDAHCDHHQLSLRARVELFVQVAQAVAHAHDQRVIHRDLKPEHVLVTEAGVIKLLDFGIAKLADHERCKDTTLLHARAWTPGYGSPEQLRGAMTGPPSDVYQLGMLLYQLLTGVRAFAQIDQRDPVALVQAIERGAPRPSQCHAGPDAEARAQLRADTPRRLQRELRGDLDCIVACAMHVDPDRRYRDAAALADDLQRWLVGVPALARVGIRGERWRRELRRYRIAIAGLLAVFVASGALAVYEYHQNQRLLVEREQAEQARARAEAVQGFLLRLFGTADARDSEHHGRDVDDLLIEGVQRIEVDFAEQPLLAAQLLVDLGDVLHQRSRLQEARDAFLRSYDLRRETLGSGHASTLVSQERYGQTLNHLGDPAAAAVEHEAVLAGREVLFGPDAPEVAEALILLARDDTALGQLDRAETLLRRALAIAESTPLNQVNAENSSEILSDLGGILHRRQRFDEAEPLFERSLALTRARHGEGHPFTLTIRRNRAANLRQLGNPELAYAEFQAVWSAERALHPGAHRKLVVTLGHLGRTATDLGHHEQAQAYWQQAVDMAIAALGAEHPWVGHSRLGLAEALLADGQSGAARREAESVASGWPQAPELRGRMDQLLAALPP